MSEPIEMIIIRAQQYFDVDDGLNPIQVEIKDDNIIYLLKKYKNVVYKITPVGLLFLASLTNDTTQVFVLGKNLSGVKKSILNEKIFDILAVIHLNKINNWSDIKGQSIWTNVAFKDHKEINNNSHLCFPFITRSFKDLTSFFLQDDTNKNIEFKSSKKKKKVFSTFKLTFSYMSRQAIKDLRWRQQIKLEQINYLLADVEKNLEEYKIALDTKEKQLSDDKKILISVKQSYDKIVAENRDLKSYIEILKQHFQEQQTQFLEKQKTIIDTLQKKIKK